MSGDDLGWFLSGALFAALSIGLLTIVQRSPGNSGRYRGSFLNYGAPGTNGSATTDFSGMSVGYEQTQDGDAGETSTNAVNGEMRDG